MQNTFTLPDSTPSLFLLLLPRLSSTMGATTCAFFHTLCGLRGRFFYFFLSFLFFSSFFSLPLLLPRRHPFVRASDYLCFGFSGWSGRGVPRNGFSVYDYPYREPRRTRELVSVSDGGLVYRSRKEKSVFPVVRMVVRFPREGGIQIRSWCWVIFRI